MSSSILVTRPNYDYSTRYISAWAGKVLEFARLKGCVTIDLDGARASGKEFKSVVEKRDPAFVFVNGHGDDNIIAGNEGEALVTAGVNDDIFRSRIVHALSCRSAKVLGRESVKNGARAYLGYDEDFIFMYTSQKRTRPLEDRTAELFLEPSNHVALSLLKGNSAGVAHGSPKSAFLRNIRKLLTSQSAPEDSASLRYLVWDMQHQVCLGDPGAMLQRTS